MASKLKLQGLNTMHTSGIFSDMSIDGPEIGTLVVIVDRAKNLPNRKTIGKQDPYCAARLGKEAKKTETDRRGGQTPKWDQELRYTVHDSPDYYQLKVSIFNDDKKTDLIGETWVDLKDVIIPGGGQNDLWHSLTCKGKYAGEIRVEITYYDSRPKQEKPEKIKQNSANGTQVESNEIQRASRQPKSAVKRRPLPSDPVTGEPATGFHTSTKSHEQLRRSMPSADSATLESSSACSPMRVSEHSHMHSRSYKNLQSEIPYHVQMSSREYRNSSSALPEHIQTARSYQTTSTTIAEHGKPHSNGYQNVSYQALDLEHEDPSYVTSRTHGNYSNTYGDFPGSTLTTSAPQQHENDQLELYNSMSRNGYKQKIRPHRSEAIENFESGNQHNSSSLPYTIPPGEKFDSPPSPGGSPPPPPAHRSSNTGNNIGASIPTPAMISQGSFGIPTESHSSGHYTNSIHAARSSTRLNKRNGSYQAYSPERDQGKYRRHSPDGSYEISPAQNHFYDTRYHNDYGSMQPTVEDAPPSPSSGRYQFECRDDREGAIPRRGSSTPVLSQQNPGRINCQTSQNSKSLISDRKGSTFDNTRSRSSSDEASEQELRSRKHSDYHAHNSMNHGMSQVPATLLPGLNPLMAQEIADRIYDERRSSFSQSPTKSLQATNQNSSRQQQSQPYGETASPQSSRPTRFSTGPMQTSGDVSPDSRPTTRKSISSSPSRPDDQKYLSGVPFGPESYNSLNPTINTSTSNLSLGAAYNTNGEQEAKIITRDGREIDPSDHIPESNYAPLPEIKGSKHRDYNPTPNTQQIARPVGRRPLRQAPRPQVSTITTSFSPTAPTSTPQDPSQPCAGRKRLQKISNRVSTHPSSPSSPLNTVSDYQCSPNHRKVDHQSVQSYTQPSYGNDSGNYSSRTSALPLPEKIMPTVASHQPWSLVPEMQNIDLYSTRIPRRGY